jgi:hypothetical protein
MRELPRHFLLPAIFSKTLRSCVTVLAPMIGHPHKEDVHMTQTRKVF